MAAPPPPLCHSWSLSGPLPAGDIGWRRGAELSSLCAVLTPGPKRTWPGAQPIREPLVPAPRLWRRCLPSRANLGSFSVWRSEDGQGGEGRSWASFCRSRHSVLSQCFSSADLPLLAAAVQGSLPASLACCSALPSRFLQGGFSRSQSRGIRGCGGRILCARRPVVLAPGLLTPSGHRQLGGPAVSDPQHGPRVGQWLPCLSSSSDSPRPYCTPPRPAPSALVHLPSHCPPLETLAGRGAASDQGGLSPWHTGQGRGLPIGAVARLRAKSTEIVNLRFS